jgi:hypothetical protein
MDLREVALARLVIVQAIDFLTDELTDPLQPRTPVPPMSK